MSQIATVVFRLVHIAIVTAHHVAAHLFATWCARVSLVSQWFPGEPLPGPARLRSALENLGGSFIKFGQMLALQPDVLTLEYCNALFDLLDRVPPLDYPAVERVFVEEFGNTPAQLFERFDRQPLASASIGQVHVAYLDGGKYAVKVQRPGARVAFTADIRLMALCGTLIRALRVRRLYWMLEPIGEFVAWTHEELDYRTEERYLQQLRRNAEGNQHERIPTCLSALTSRRTLATEFLDGVTVLGYLRTAEGTDDIARHRAKPSGFEPARFAQHIIDNFLSDVFRHGLFHADLHPANLMILPDNAVGYIDFGITGAISEYSRENLVALTLAYTRGDINGMGDAFFNVCVIGDAGGPARFRSGLRAMAADWYEHSDGAARLKKNFTLVMLDMLRLSHRTGVWPERDVIKYIRSAIAIDGLITRFAPSFDVGAYLQHVCAQHLRWNARQKLLRIEGAAEWLAVTARLMQTGSARAEAVLGRVSSFESAAAAVRCQRDDATSAEDRYQALLLGLVVLLLAVATSLGGSAETGSGFRPAQMLVGGAAAARLLTFIRRLA